MLLEGSEGIAELGRQADITGNILDSETAAAAAKVVDDIGVLRSTVEGLGTHLLAAFAPALGAVTGALNTFATSLGEARIEAQRLAPFIEEATRTVREQEEELRPLQIGWTRLRDRQEEVTETATALADQQEALTDIAVTLTATFSAGVPVLQKFAETNKTLTQTIKDSGNAAAAAREQFLAFIRTAGQARNVGVAARAAFRNAQRAARTERQAGQSAGGDPTREAFFADEFGSFAPAPPPRSHGSTGGTVRQTINFVVDGEVLASGQVRQVQSALDRGELVVR